MNAGAPARSGRIAGAVALAVVLCSAAASRAAEDEARLWLVVTSDAALAEKVSTNLQVQARFSNDVDDLERVVLRPWLAWAIHERVSLALGYDAHVFVTPGGRVEHRIWQQASLATPVARWEIGHRLRLEERFLEGVSGAALRLRYRLRTTHPLGGEGLHVAVSNEVFFNLDSPRRGPNAGFGENRFFVGLGWQPLPWLGVEGGYQLQYVERPGEDAANHTILLGLSF